MIVLTSFVKDDNTNTVKDSKITEQKKNSKLFTESQWALQSNYLFAVNVKNFDGDNYEPGKYMFDTSNKKIKEAPVYDIYITKKYHSNLSKVIKKGHHYVVGEIDSFPVKINLHSNRYVYVIPYKKLVYEPKGYLIIKKIK